MADAGLMPLIVVSTIDQVLRDSAVFAAMSGSSGTVVLRQDLDPDSGELHRVVSDETGVVQRSSQMLDHTCMGCAVREDMLPAIADLVEQNRWKRIILLSPLTAESTPVTRPLADVRTARELGISLRAAITVVDSAQLIPDLMGDDLLIERALSIGRDDNRSVGEALAAQIGQADLTLTVGDDAAGLTMVQHLRGHKSGQQDLFEIDAHALFANRHRRTNAEARLDPRCVQPPTAGDAHGVWSLNLKSSKPFHPGRFFEMIEKLGAGRIRSRGRFYLASRPVTVGMWDGAGGQVSVGDAGSWEGTRPSTQLIFTGIDDDRMRIRSTFDRIVMTEAELAKGRQHWIQQGDELDDWLGEAESVA
ncbi:GTP-binding protein [Nakamurella antarctica]|uniref:GTP-binding protein n=1 Tax=Nakamurella antarctica TaxID=1902245 RepID=A0A3G8ZNT9_9ACTN|nr:GTP-binding protein [Nakamurella antarctica]AZI58959.1 GTP-binding protein [Nakamurella antarctica]